MQPFPPDPRTRTAQAGTDRSAVEALWRQWREKKRPDFTEFAGGGLSAEQSLALLQFDQTQRWQSGERVPAEAYLEAYPFLKTDPAHALTLVYGEFLRRQELGERPTLEEYVARFPTLADRLKRHGAPPQETAPLPARAGACRIQAEIGRGGMGVVLKGHDENLGRELAVKVLAEEYRNRPDAVRRFLDEAQVSGQLQHPGIVPVHELGRFEDGRPYFTMKLVQGRTLADLLAERAGPTQDLARFLEVFGHVCQTVAYAHARGVIHRDLKPGNVMLGAFGEVQVLDWGLAKRLPDASPAQTPPGTEIRVVGTPAYMAPEQAKGQGDERCDVFGLGAILCEILTGRPPYSARSAREAMGMAERADLSQAIGRLDASGADPELVQLARECLAPAPEARPRNAGAVAERLTAYLEGVQKRLREAQVERAAAQARAEEAVATAAAERRSRRLTLGLAGAILVLIAGGGGGALWFAQRRARTELAVQSDLDRAWALQSEGKRSEAELAIRHAEGLLGEGRDHVALRRRVAETLADVDMVATVEEIRLQQAELTEAARRKDPRHADEAYAKAFQKYGLPVDELTVEEAAARIRRRAIAAPLALALDHWALQRRSRKEVESGRWKHLLEVARRADADAFRGRFRDALLTENREGLLALGKEIAGLKLPAPILVALAAALEQGGEAPAAVAVLRAAVQHAPGDFWVHFELARASLIAVSPPDFEQAERHYTAALALRPHNPVIYSNLGFALLERGNFDRAIAFLREAIRMEPRLAAAHCNLATVFSRKGDFDAALPVYREAIRLQPDLPEAHFNLGYIFSRKDQPEQAVSSYEEAIRLRPDYASAHNNLGNLYLRLGKLDQAIPAFEKAIAFNPRHVRAHNNLIDALLRRRAPGDLPAALAAADKTVELEPEPAAAHARRGLILSQLERFTESLAALDRALALKPDGYGIHYTRAEVLLHLGRIPESLAGLDRAVSLKADYVEAHHARGQVLMTLGRPSEAAVAFREAVRLKPDSAEAHCLLGLAVGEAGNLTDALGHLKQGHELGSRSPQWAAPSLQWLSDAERLIELDKKLPSLLSGETRPAGAPEALLCARLCRIRGRLRECLHYYEEAFKTDPGIGEDLTAGHRLQAARAAARIACGADGGAEEVRTRLRSQALEWLKSDLVAVARRLEKDPQARIAAREFFHRWRVDPDLAGLRDEAELEKLPADDREACRNLWIEVDALLRRASNF